MTTTVQLIENQQLLEEHEFEDRVQATGYVGVLLRQSSDSWSFDPIEDRWTYADRTIQLEDVADTDEEKLARAIAKIAQVEALQAQAAAELTAVQNRQAQLAAYLIDLLAEKEALEG